MRLLDSLLSRSPLFLEETPTFTCDKVSRQFELAIDIIPIEFPSGHNSQYHHHGQDNESPN